MGKTPHIPYTIQKELSKKYKISTDNPHNWKYLEDTDQFLKPNGVVYSFKHCSSRTGKYGFKRDFKIYEADKVQDTLELEQLAKTDNGRQKPIHYNPL